jgi:hypothetical protein
MSLCPSLQLQQERYTEVRNYLIRFPWEWMATLTYEPGIKYFPALEYFKHWRLKIIDKEKLRVGGYAVMGIKKGLQHLHCLMFGRNQNGKTLLDCSTRYWNAEWPFFARISEVNNHFGSCNYLGINLLGFKSDHAEIFCFDSKLLKRNLRHLYDGLDGYDGLDTMPNMTR